MQEGDPDPKIAAGGVCRRWDLLRDTAEGSPGALDYHRHSLGGHCMHWDRHKVDLGKDSGADGSAGVALSHMQRVRLDRHYNRVAHRRPHSIHT